MGLSLFRFRSFKGRGPTLLGTLNAPGGEPGDVLTVGADGYIAPGPAGGGITTVTASDVDSESATDGQVLTADGAGAAAWQNGSGGGSSAHGFAATLNNDTAYTSGDTVKPDLVFHDTDSYYDAATGVATIPAGLGGLYLLSYYGESGTALLTALAIKTVVSGAFDNNVFLAGAPLTGTADLAGGVVAYLSAGDAVHGIVLFAGPATATLVANQTGFGLAYLGSA